MMFPNGSPAPPSVTVPAVPAVHSASTAHPPSPRVTASAIHGGYICPAKTRGAIAVHRVHITLAYRRWSQGWRGTFRQIRYTLLPVQRQIQICIA